MKKNVLLITGLLLSNILSAQIGINTPAPQATLDVTAKTTDGTKPEGFIPPRLTGDQIKSGDAQYGINQKGSIVYATSAVTTPSTKTNEISSEGYYFFDGSVWKKLGTGTYTGSTSVSLSGSSFQRAALTGDVTAALNNNSTTVTALQGRSVSSTAPTSGQILKWIGTNWIPSVDDNTIYTANNGLNINSNTVKLGGTITEPTTISGLTATNKLAITGTGVDAVNFDSNTLSIDATNNLVGIGTNTPTNPLHVTAASNPLRLQGLAAGNVSTEQLLAVDSNGVVKNLGTISSLSIPTPAVFRLNANINNFLSTAGPGVTQILPMSLLKNSISGLSYNSGTGTLTLPAGTYQFTLVYEAIHDAVGCTISSYFVDMPNGSALTRIHTTASHVQGGLAIHGGSLTYATTISSARNWTIHLGRGQSGNCEYTGMTLIGNSTELLIFRIGD